jgi:hypothetical protein
MQAFDTTTVITFVLQDGSTQDLPLHVFTAHPEAFIWGLIQDCGTELPKSLPLGLTRRQLEKFVAITYGQLTLSELSRVTLMKLAAFGLVNRLVVEEIEIGRYELEQLIQSRRYFAEQPATSRGDLILVNEQRYNAFKQILDPTKFIPIIMVHCDGQPVLVFAYDELPIFNNPNSPNYVVGERLDLNEVKSRTFFPDPQAVDLRLINDPQIQADRQSLDFSHQAQVPSMLRLDGLYPGALHDLFISRERDRFLLAAINTVDQEESLGYHYEEYRDQLPERTLVVTADVNKICPVLWTRTDDIDAVIANQPFFCSVSHGFGYTVIYGFVKV